MTGKKGSLHSGWIDQKHIRECLEAYVTYSGNCRVAAGELNMSHQYLRWVWVRAGLKPKGVGKPPLVIDLNLIELYHRYGNISKASLELGINRSTATRMINKYKEQYHNGNLAP